MKHLKLYNESIREYLKPKSEEEIEKAWENTIIKLFQDAYEQGESNPNLDYLGDKWEIYSEPFHLYDNYYFYKDMIMLLNTYETGGWYNTDLKVIEDVDTFKSKMIKKIDQIEKGLKKLNR